MKFEVERWLLRCILHCRCRDCVPLRAVTLNTLTTSCGGHAKSVKSLNSCFVKSICSDHLLRESRDVVHAQRPEIGLTVWTFAKYSRTANGKIMELFCSISGRYDRFAVVYLVILEFWVQSTELSPSQRHLLGTHCQLTFVIVVVRQHLRNISRLSCFM